VVGIAAAGTLAGAPGAAGFVDGFHGVALGACGLYLVAAAVAFAWLPGRVLARRAVSAASR